MRDNLLELRETLDGEAQEAFDEFVEALSAYIPTAGGARFALKTLTRMIRQQTAPTNEESGVMIPPLVAPALYVPHRSGKPSEFLKTHWRPWLEAGVLYQRHIRKLDPRLMVALSNEFTGRRSELTALLPPKTVEAEQLIQESGVAVPSKPGRRSQVLSEMRSRKDRGLQIKPR